MPAELAFILGMMAGALTLWIIQGWRRRARERVALKAREAVLVEHNDRLGGELSALKQRLSVLEEIAIDPGHRTLKEIEGLR